MKVFIILFFLVAITFYSDSQVYTSEDSNNNNRTILVTNFNDNIESLPPFYVGIGMYFDNVYTRSGPLIHNNKMVNLTYHQPKRFMLNALLGPLNGSLEGTIFAGHFERLKEKGLLLKSEGRTVYYTNRPRRTHHLFGVHLLTGIESIRTGSTTFGKPVGNYGNLGLGASYLLYRSVNMSVDNIPVKSVSHFLKVNADFIVSLPFNFKEYYEGYYIVQPFLYGGRVAVEGRLGTIKQSITFNYMAGLSVTKYGRTSGISTYEEATEIGPIYGLGVGWHF